MIYPAHRRLAMESKALVFGATFWLKLKLWTPTCNILLLVGLTH